MGRTILLMLAVSAVAQVLETGTLVIKSDPNVKLKVNTEEVTAQTSTTTLVVTPGSYAIRVSTGQGDKNCTPNPAVVRSGGTITVQCPTGP